MSQPDFWIFGYGSLIWRPDFPYEERVVATLRSWVRRFWQASTDHRGVPDAPGRVVTLVRNVEGSCVGVAYRVAPEHVDAVVERLDHREKGGYEQHDMELNARDGRTLYALVYLATETNENFLGPAPLPEMVSQIRSAEGPSGKNIDYLLHLHRALQHLGAEDPHVEELAGALEAEV